MTTPNFPLSIDTDPTAYPLQFAWVDPAQLTEHDLNWKTHPQSQLTGLAEFISQVGWAGALLYNTTTGKMPDGHARKKLPETTRVNGKVPVLYGAWTVEQELAIIRYLDPLGQMYIEDAAASKIIDDQLSSGDESISNLLSTIIDEPVAGVPTGDIPIDEPDDAEQLVSRAPEFQEKWNVEQGQWWQLGRHKVYCGDSRDVADEFKCDLLLVDPQYGIDIVPKSGNTIGGPKPSKRASIQNICAREYEPVHGDDGAFNPEWLLSLGENSIIWGANAFASKLPDRYSWLVWDKQVADHLSFSQCELAWHTFGKSVRLFVWKWSGVQRKGERSIEGRHRLHPTQKPVGLYRQILQHYIKQESIAIADPYLGSGTTLLACELENHICIAGEYEPMYVATTLERYSNLTDNIPTLMDDTPNA